MKAKKQMACPPPFLGKDSAQLDIEFLIPSRLIKGSDRGCTHLARAPGVIIPPPTVQLRSM